MGNSLWEGVTKSRSLNDEGPPDRTWERWQAEGKALEFGRGMEVGGQVGVTSYRGSSSRSPGASRPGQ